MPAFDDLDPLDVVGGNLCKVPVPALLPLTSRAPGWSGITHRIGGQPSDFDQAGQGTVVLVDMADAGFSDRSPASFAVEFLMSRHEIWTKAGTSF
jgi:hypothetical protein